MKGLFLLVFVIGSFVACNVGSREKALQQREDSLDTREQQLVLREKTVALKEQELSEREQHLDTTQIADSTHVVNPLLMGTWSVKMTCTETTCPGSAVGDTKSEQWLMSYEGNTLIARAMLNNQLARVYSGFYTANSIELTDEKLNAPAQPVAKMVVRLRIKDDTHLEGQREILRDKDCKIVYDLQLEKQH